MSAVKILLTAEEFDSERPGALHRKLKHYFQAGVKEAWIIDPETNTAEIRTGASLPEREFSRLATP